MGAKVDLGIVAYQDIMVWKLNRSRFVMFLIEFMLISARSP